jgi:hypothetical protein
MMTTAFLSMGVSSMIEIASAVERLETLLLILREVETA